MHIVAFLSIVNNKVYVNYDKYFIINEFPFHISSWIISYFVIMKVFNVYDAYQKNSFVRMCGEKNHK